METAWQRGLQSGVAAVAGGLIALCMDGLWQQSVQAGDQLWPQPISQTQYSDAAVPDPSLYFVAAAPTPPPPVSVSPYSSQMFDNNFRYKRDPNHAYILGEEFKDMPLCVLTDNPLFCDTTVSTGGELRFRYIDELNRLRPGGPGESSYDQWRWRHYIDVKHFEYLRAYVELIDASTNHADLPLQGIDKNRWDLQNYFLDVDLSPFDQPLWLRVGRQELLYGSQRLVSPLDWSNIRRNFEGLKLFTKGDSWDVDLFVVNPVNTATPNADSLDNNDNSFDIRNHDYLLSGVWATYKGLKEHTFDAFWLYSNINFPVTGYPFGDRYTLGTRWLGNFPVAGGDHMFHGEIEGGYQFGNDRSAMYAAASPRASVQAGYFTAGAGHTWKALAWQPSLWWYWDWASGDNDPTDGINSTFFQMVGFVHFYMGLIDNVARQNISDVNFRYTIKPDPKLQFMLAHHWFQLDNGNDVLYNVTGAPVGTPGNGTAIGNELDLVATCNFTPNWSVEAGYFWFWYGDYIANVAPRGDATQVYVMSTLRY